MTHRFYPRILLILIGLVLAAPATANWMGGFVLDHGATSYLGHTELARVDFDFKVTNANGVRFVVDGYHNGSAVPGRLWGGSSLYPMGTTASHSNFIRFDSGTVEVDQYRIAMFDPVTAEVLLEMFLPVEYFFGPNAVNDFQLNYTSPSWILNGENLVINFAYQTNETGGVRVSARPYTNGALSSGYGASGLALLPVGTGTGTQWFTFSSLAADVDEIRITMLTADQLTILLEFFVPVDLHWGPNSISNITFDPPYPEFLAWEQPVTVEFDYAMSDPNGCLAWVWGLGENENSVSGQIFSGSPVELSSGHLVRQFWMPTDSGEGAFKYAYFRVKDQTASNDLMTISVPIDYAFGPNVAQNVSFYPAAPAVLDFGERVDVSFDYVVDDPAGLRIYTFPFTYAGTTPGWGISGSIAYVGTGSGTSFFTINSGSNLVNSVQMRILELDASTFVTDFFVAGNFTFGGTGGVTSVPDVAVLAGSLLQQNYPNPFNPQTTIAFDLPGPTAVSLRVFDLSGRLVKELMAGEALLAGPQQAVWNGRDDSGRRVASGTYFYRLEAGKVSETRRMALVK